MNLFNNRILQRASVALAVVSLITTTAMALLSVPEAAADPSLEARRIAQANVTRKAKKKKPPQKRARAVPLQGVVNINTATEDQLTKLPGIGPAKAERIVDYRKKRGKFRRVRDLRRVKGIGRMTVKRLGRHLSITGPTTLR